MPKSKSKNTKNTTLSELSSEELFRLLRSTVIKETVSKIIDQITSTLPDGGSQQKIVDAINNVKHDEVAKLSASKTSTEKEKKEKRTSIYNLFLSYFAKIQGLKVASPKLNQAIKELYDSKNTAVKDILTALLEYIRQPDNSSDEYSVELRKLNITNLWQIAEALHKDGHPINENLAKNAFDMISQIEFKYPAEQDDQLKPTEVIQPESVEEEQPQPIKEESQKAARATTQPKGKGKGKGKEKPEVESQDEAKVIVPAKPRACIQVSDDSDEELSDDDTPIIRSSKKDKSAITA